VYMIHVTVTAVNIRINIIIIEQLTKIKTVKTEWRTQYIVAIPVLHSCILSHSANFYVGVCLPSRQIESIRFRFSSQYLISNIG